MSPSPIRQVCAYLRVSDSAAAIDFYTRAFGAVEQFRLTEPSGRVGHAELHFGPAVLKVSDAFPEYGLNAPGAGDESFVAIHLQVDDADAIAEQALAAGATLVMAPTDQFYGHRSCKLRDPFGHVWMVNHEIEAVTPEEMQRRYTAMFVAE